jgi:hypothetical protein
MCSSRKIYLQYDCNVHPLDVWDSTSEQTTTTSSISQAHYRTTSIPLTYSDVEPTLRFINIVKIRKYQPTRRD